jgi:hypothetical protein
MSCDFVVLLCVIGIVSSAKLEVIQRLCDTKYDCSLDVVKYLEDSARASRPFSQTIGEMFLAVGDIYGCAKVAHRLSKSTSAKLRRWVASVYSQVLDYPVPGANNPAVGALETIYPAQVSI